MLDRRALVDRRQPGADHEALTDADDRGGGDQRRERLDPERQREQADAAGEECAAGDERTTVREPRDDHLADDRGAEEDEDDQPGERVARSPEDLAEEDRRDRAEDACDREAAEACRGAADEDAAHFRRHPETLDPEAKCPPLHRLGSGEQAEHGGREQAELDDEGQPQR